MKPLLRNWLKTPTGRDLITAAAGFFLLLPCIAFGAKSSESAEIYTIQNRKYLAARALAEQHNVRTEYYENNNKLVLRFPGKKTVLSAHCSFLKIGDDIYQLPYPVLFQDNEFYVPARRFSGILNANNMMAIELDIRKNKATATSPDYNLCGLNIENKANGSLIRIKTSRLFSSEDVGVSFTSGGWMSITVMNGLVDSIGIAESVLQPPVRRVRTVQSRQSAQVSLLLQYSVDDYDMSVQAGELVLALRTNLRENAEKIKEMRNRWLLDTVVIDAGHGGKDPGALGVYNLQEKTVTLDIARRLGKLISKNMGIKVVYTREEDVFVPLKDRTRIANEAGGKLFISIHANSTGTRRAKGVETFFLSPAKTKDAIEVAQRENSVIGFEDDQSDYEHFSTEDVILSTMAQSMYMKESEQFAALIQNEFDRSLKTYNRGVKQAKFYVLVGASMPNVLVEVGFLSNKKECKQLGSASYRQKIAESIYAAVVEYKDRYESNILGAY